MRSIVDLWRRIFRVLLCLLKINGLIVFLGCLCFWSNDSENSIHDHHKQLLDGSHRKLNGGRSSGDRELIVRVVVEISNQGVQQTDCDQGQSDDDADEDALLIFSHNPVFAECDHCQDKKADIDSKEQYDADAAIGFPSAVVGNIGGELISSARNREDQSDECGNMQELDAATATRIGRGSFTIYSSPMRRLAFSSTESLQSTFASCGNLQFAANASHCCHTLNNICTRSRNMIGYLVATI